MPTYEYRCRDCGHSLEAVQSFNDDPLTECPSCGGDLRKVFAAPGISFKGSGFYKTDSRGSSSSSSSSSDTAGSSSDGGGKDSATKESASKDSGSKESGSKDTGTKDTGGSTKKADSSPASTPSTS